MNSSCYPAHSPLLSVSEAQAQIIQALQRVPGCECVALTNALGRILAETVYATAAIPAHRVSAMDGYAFCSTALQNQSDTALALAGTAWAGKPFDGHASLGQCVRIFTGAVVPDFADSVVVQENVIRTNDGIIVPAGTAPYKNIRDAGSDVEESEALLHAPHKLSAVDLGLLAAAGVSQVVVQRKLKIGFFSTGDELVALGNPLRKGQIYDSNRYLLSGLLCDPAHQVTDLGVIEDDCEQLEETLLAAAGEFDLLITTGGASVGDADFVKQTLEKCGEIRFWKLAIKPGKPLAFGKIKQCWFFGLPGNPVAVLVTYKQFVQPALQRLSGLPLTSPLRLLARSEAGLRKSPGRQEYQRGILSQTATGEFSVKPAGRQDSHQLKATSAANCFIVLGHECATVAAGDMVVVEPFGTELLS